MRSNDIKTLRQILREAMRASGRQRRELEVILGLGRGNLERLTDGTLEIKARHLLDLAEFLDVPPADFFIVGCPETTGKAHRRLTDWIAPGRSVEDARTPAAVAEPPMSRAEVAQLVREELRNALRDAGALAPSAGAGEPQAD